MESVDRYNWKKGIFLWGAGQNGNWCLDYLKRCNIKVVGFIDSNANLENVISYDEYVEKYSSYLVLVTAKHATKEIVNKCCNEFILSFDKWFLEKNKKLYSQLIFNDEKSYIVLDTLIKAMTAMDESILSSIAEKDQYLAISPFFGNISETYIDLGAYCGDTIEKFIFAQNGAFEKIYAFEPGYRQRIGLKYRIDRLNKEWCLNEDKIIIVPYAVSNFSGKIKFDNSKSLTSCSISEKDDNTQECEITSLDVFFEKKDITNIKVDIEGQEYEMLLGAENLIKRCKPKIAISVYHKPDDLLRIYDKLKEYCPEYKFSLRHHSSSFMETVLYAFV